MNETGLIVLLLALPAASVAFIVLKARGRQEKPALPNRSNRSGHVRVVTNIDGPNRNLSETLPRRNRALAEADRHFYGYERVRAPRYRPDLDEKRAEILRPVQVIRVGSRIEREEIEEQIPRHLRVIFLEENPPAVASQPQSRA